MSDSRYILLCITSDTIIALCTGTFDEVSNKRNDYESICQSTGGKLKLESVDPSIEKEVITSTSKLMEVYGHLLSEEVKDSGYSEGGT